MPARVKLGLPRRGDAPPRRVKRLLVKAGQLSSPNGIYWLLGVFNYVHVGWWIKRNGFPIDTLVDDRDGVFDRITAQVAGKQVLYLEFGVADGDSMRHFCRLLDHPDARLHGFDSFEGLPTGWAVDWSPGYFSQHGRAPQFDDPRVELFKGWFADTLPGYVWPEGYEQLIVNVDCDLYSSAAYVLEAIEHRLAPETIIYFDEFHHYADELRAFDELTQRTGWPFEVLAATRDFSQVAFRRVA